MSQLEYIKVLLVENDRAAAKLISKKMKSLKWDLNIAHTAKYGLNACQKEKYDILCIEYDLPDTTEFSFVRQLLDREDCPPILILTSPGTEKLMVEAFSLGVTDYIIKDIEGNYIDLLGPIISRTVAHRRIDNERREYQKRLYESEERFRKIVESINEGIWYINADALTTYVNPRMAEMLGYTADEMMDKHLFEFMDEQGKEIARRYLKEREEGVREQHEFEFIRKNGERLYALLETAPMFDDAGTYIGAVAGIQDITDRKITESALIESEKKYKDLVSNIADIIYIVDDKGTIRYINNAFTTMSDYSEEELIGRNFGDLVSPESYSYSEEKFKKQIAGENVGAFRLTFRRKDGGKIVLEIRERIVWDQNRIVEIHGIARDITDRVQAEEEQQKTSERARAQRAALSELTEQEALASGNLNDALRVLTEQASIAMNVNRVGVWLLSDDGEEMRNIEQYEAEKGIHSEGAILITKQYPEYWEAIRRESRINADDTQTDPRTIELLDDFLIPLGITSMLDAAIMRNGQLAGVICFEHTGSKRVWWPDEQSFANTIAAIAAQILVNADRRKAEEQNRLFAEMVNVAPNSITVHDFAGNMIYANRKTFEMHGFTEDEFMNINLHDLDIPESAEKIEKRMRLIREQGEATFEVSHYRKDGTSFPLLVLVKKIQLQDGQYALLSIATDISEIRQAEEQLRLQSLVLDQIDESVTITGLDGKITYVNEAQERNLGLNKKEIIGQTTEAYSNDPLRKAIQRGILKRTLDDGAWRGEVVNYTVSGNEIILDLRTRIIHNEAGKPVCLVGIGNDITEQKKAIEALRESEEKYRTLVTNTLQGVVIAQSEPIRISFANPVMKTITGYDIEELLSMTQNELPVLIHPEDRQRFFSNFQKRIEGESIPVQDEYRIICKDGTIKWMSIYSSLIEFVGEPATLTTFLDITEKRKAEGALQESEKKYRELFDSSIDVVFLSTIDGKFIDINRAGEDLFGYTRDEIFSLDIRNIYYDPQDRTKLLRTVEQNGYVKNYELVLKKKDGSSINVLLSETLRRDQKGVVIGYQGILRDITELKRTQSQLTTIQKMEALGTLTGGIAHDFNNILSTIMGYSSFLKSKVDVNSDLFLGLDSIEKASFRASELTNQLLAYTRKGERTITTFNINRVITEVYDLIFKTFDKSIEIRLNTDRNIPPIDGDESQIYQVVMNLAVNSQQAMSKGGVLIIETFSRNVSSAIQKEYFEIPPGIYTCFEIVDTGVGMNEEIVSKVFEPYFTTRNDQGGSGLGMSVVYGIVKGHNGYIEVESEQGQGTKVTVCFPISRKEEGVAKKPVLDVNGGSEKILIIDDEKEILGMMSSILRESGYTVYITDSGKDGIDLYKEVKPDLVILDLKMPKMDGREVFRELIKINPNVKALLSTGFVDAKEKNELVNMGAKGFIKKPYTASDIKKKVKEIFG